MKEFSNNYFIDKNSNVYSNKSGVLKKLKSAIGKNGYELVTTSHNSKLKSYHVHRLLAKHFIKNFDPLLDVNHIDGNKLNNSLENLEMVTRKQNLIHASRLGLIRKRPYLSKENVRSKLDDCHMLTVATLQDISNRGLGRVFNCSHATIKRIKKQAVELGI